MKRPHMVGKTNYFKHTPGIGLAMFLLAVLITIGFPFMLIILVLFFKNPWLLIPIFGLTGLVVVLHAIAKSAKNKQSLRELGELEERLERDLEKIKERHQRESTERELIDQIRYGFIKRE